VSLIRVMDGLGQTVRNYRRFGPNRPEFVIVILIFYLIIIIIIFNIIIFIFILSKGQRLKASIFY
jgi:hypothetical protein